MNLYCDNYATCNSVLFELHNDPRINEILAMAKGWAFYEGKSLTGKKLKVVYCKKCIHGRRRDLPPAPEYLSGQLELELTDEGSTDPLS